MGWQRCALFLAAGTSGVVASTLFGGDPAATAIATTSSNAILNVGSGFVQNGLQSSYESVVAAITGRARTTDGLPINHDLARAIRRSHLDAISYLIDGFETDSKDPYLTRSHRPNQRRFISAAQNWVKAEHKLTERPDFLADRAHETAIEEVRTVIESACSETPENAFKLLADEAKREAMEEFAVAMRDAGHPVPPEFEGYFDGNNDLLPWSLAAQAFFAHRLKGDEKVRTVVFLDRFNALGRGQADILSAVESLRSASGDLADRMAAIEQKINAIMSRVSEAPTIDQVALANAIATAVAEGGLVDQIVRQVILAQSGLHSVAQTAWQVQQRIEELTTRFFGREDVFSELDAFADSRDPGMMVLTAPAGSGKSACLANWVKRRRKNDPYLIGHFISGKLPLTNGSGEITGHLAAQLSLSTAVGSETANVRSQNLFAALKNCPHPVTLVLDGLDEAATLMEPFIEAGACPSHVRIIVSARASVGEWPNYLATWRRLEQPGFSISRINLAPLSPEESLLWLEDYVGHLPDSEMQALANQLRRASDGLPLFFAFILEDLLTALPQAPTAEARQRLIRDVPAPFTDYIDHEMDAQKPPWTSQERQLFALLSVLKGPIAFDELTAIAADRYPDPHGLSHKLTRWLTISVFEDRQIISFAHQKLAEAFILALQNQVAEEEEKLLVWARRAWCRRGTAMRPIAGSRYALDWLPEHLIACGEHVEAGRLLTNADYLSERLNSPTFGPQRLTRHINSWFQLSEADWPEHGRLWNAALVENESRLIRLAHAVPFARTCLHRVVANCLADSGVPNMGPTRTNRSNVPPKQNLLRNQELAHDGAVLGVRLIGDRLVSWGRDGAIRFWSNQGEPMPGGDYRAHEGAVLSVKLVGDQLVSWGIDGAIRFWSNQGEPMPGGADPANDRNVRGVELAGDRLVSWSFDGTIQFWSNQGEPMPGGGYRAHEGAVLSVKIVGDRLVSWGIDGAIRFWSNQGEPMPGGDDRAHDGTVLGVKLVGDRLVSWGDDGAIRFWSNQGDPMLGGDDRAHEGEVLGVKLVGDRLVSWGDDGAIRFWSNQGEPMLGGDDRAHEGEVRGVTLIGDRLVSWGRDGAIRFWSNQGELMPGGHYHAHRGWVLSVTLAGDRLVSWGRDGAIRFWSNQGEPMPGGDDRAHDGTVRGVTLAGDRLVTWGREGAIRFWTNQGEPMSGCDDRAHDGMVLGVKLVGDQLVSWGSDGAIRFWSNRSEPMPGGDDRGHEGEVLGVKLVGDRLVSWGNDGAIRFWSNQGEPMPGGDDRAHEGAVGGVKLIGDQLVSWGRDGAIRFWSTQGEPMPGGHDRAHDRAVWDVKLVGDRLISWGDDGAIRFWSTQGEPMPGGHDRAHNGQVWGVKLVGDRLVSWGNDGAIRFWSNQGEPMPGGSYRGHNDPVRGLELVGDRLLSWGYMGAIRIWSSQGEPMPGGDDRAHDGPVGGITLLGDQLLSWGDDGAIRFWSNQGEPMPGGDDRAHEGAVGGVKLVGDQLVSWGRDGAIRFWSTQGEPMPGGDDRAHEGAVGGVKLVGDQLVSWGRDGAIRFWSREGHPTELIMVPGGFARGIFAMGRQLIVPGRTMWIYDAEPQPSASNKFSVSNLLNG